MTSHDTARPTPKSRTPPAPRLTGAAPPTRRLTVRLPIDLYSHLLDLARLGGSDLSSTLIAIVRQHQTGSAGAAELARMAGGLESLEAHAAEIGDLVSEVRDDLDVVRGAHSRTLADLSGTLQAMLELLRDSGQPADAGQPSGGGLTFEVTDAPAPPPTWPGQVKRVPTPGGRDFPRQGGPA